MVNILEIQKQENKQLLNEIEVLKKWLANKEQQVWQFEENVKLRILKTVHGITDRSESSNDLMLLEKFTWPEQGWIDSSIGKIDNSLYRYLDSINWDERMFKKYVVFSKDFTLENVIESIGQKMRSREESYFLSFRGYQFLESQLKEKVMDLEKNITELEKTKDERIEELKAKLEEKDSRIKELEERVEIEQEQVKEVIAVGEKWSKNQAEDIKEKNKKLKSASEKVSYLEIRVEKLEEETSQKSKKIEKLSKQLVDSESQNENLKWLDHLNSKPLPALPIEEENKILTKQSIFKQLKTKAKVKIQKFQGLIKKDKFHNQEMIARVEIKSK